MANPRMTAIYDSFIKNFVACLALVVMAGPVMAECVTVGQWRDATVKGSPSLVIAPPETVGPLLADIVTRAYDAAPPASRSGADTVVMLVARDRASGLPLGQAYFALVKGGCLVGSYLVPLPTGAMVKSGEPV